jgi:hypothetical protein
MLQSLRAEEDSKRSSSESAIATLEASERAWQAASRSNANAQQNVAMLVACMSKLTDELSTSRRQAAARAQAAQPSKAVAAVHLFQLLCKLLWPLQIACVHDVPVIDSN